jgi:hypothetical protein
MMVCLCFVSVFPPFDHVFTQPLTLVISIALKGNNIFQVRNDVFVWFWDDVW